MVERHQMLRYAVLDISISICALGFFSPSWAFRPLLILELLTSHYSFYTSPLDFIIVSILRVALLKFYENNHISTRLLNLTMLLAVFSYSYSLTKLLAFSSNDDYLKYPGVWISIAWTILASLPFYKVGINIDENRNSSDYRSLLNVETTEDSFESHTDEVQVEEDQTLSQWQVLKMFVTFCRNQLFWFSLGFVFLTLYALALIFIPYYTGQVIDDIVKSRGTEVLTNSVFIMGTLTTVSAILCGVQSGSMEYAIGKMFNEIRSRLFRSLVHQEVAFFDVNKSGEIVSRLTSDCEKIKFCVGMNMKFFLRNVIMLIGSLLFMLSLSWRLALVNFIGLPLASVLVHWFGSWFDNISAHVQDTTSKANQVAEEVISSIRTVKSFACENRESARFDVQLHTTQKAFTKKSYIITGYVFSNEIWQNALLVAVLCYGGFLVHDEKMRADYLITFMLYQVQLNGILWNLLNDFTGLMEAIGASRKIFAYILREPKLAANGSERPEIQGRIEFANVHFTYPSRLNNPVLKGLNLTIDAGQITALVGPSGGGKSSIVSLIQHFYEPNEGSITIDGTPIMSISHALYHERVALVAQEPILYCGSIRYNILYGCDWATEEDMLNAARMANVHDFVSQLDDGYDTECGEKGVQMSGGQKQRIAIARALVRRPSVLILDEATSALDAEPEALVQEAINRCSKERTVLIIAHRLSTIEKADKIAFIQNGKLVQLGTHADMMADQVGLYYKLVSKQSLLG